jgi:hypothetical protein
MKTNNTSARLFGLFFILAFISYGIGFSWIESITASKHPLEAIMESKTMVIIGGILMALVHTLSNIGLAVIMFFVLKPIHKQLAYGYYSAAIVSTILLLLGSIFLLLLVPISDTYLTSSGSNLATGETLVFLCKRLNFFTYQLGMVIWGIGGLAFCVLLIRSKLTYKWICIWGFLGYLIFITGCVFELFDHEIGVWLSIPGGSFELTLSIIFLVKGFNQSITNQKAE